MTTTAQRPEAAKVLIVDDQPTVRSFVSRVLTDAGYTTASASGGPEALNIIETTGPVDVLVTDLVMPDMRGDELVRRVRQMHRHLKVLYVTGQRDQLLKSTSTREEDEAVLDKPFRIQDLLEAVSTLLGRADSGVPAAAEGGAPQHVTRRLLRVLLVEDVAADGMLIQRELERTRFDIECERVETKTALITALERQTWDLLITDHTMPQFNAMAVLRIVRDRGLTVPCVLVSGTASEQTAAAAMKIGADDFVSKNDLKALGPSVTRALEDADTRRARSSLSRVRLPNGQEFDVLEWSPDAAILTGLVGLKPGNDHECLLLSDDGATRVRIHVARSEVATLTPGRIVYQTIVNVLPG
jgi:CheY-like chemotaxis protein